MYFGQDTIVADIWYRTLNIDVDNKRIVQLITSKDTSIFQLPNSVKNSTYITFYSIKVEANRLLWIEDNFYNCLWH